MTGTSNSYHAASIIVFAVVGVFLGNILEILLKNFNSPIPYTVLLFYLGVAMSAVVSYLEISLESFLDVSPVSADLIVFGLLPALLFRETLNSNWHHMTQTFGQALLLAGPGSVIVCVLLAICAYGILPFNWGWYYCFLFGAILCATDPVSVVALLKSTKASAKLTMTISGESLLNDGSAMILYLFFFKMINGKVFTFPSFLAFAAENIILSPLIGCAFGVITCRLMRRFDSSLHLRLNIQLMLTLSCGYGSYFVAEYILGVSGVFSCCTAGVVVSLFAPLKVLSDHQFHSVWENLEWGCNTLIFLLAGFIGGGRSTIKISGTNVCYLFVFFALLQVTRGVMTFMLLPVMNKVGQQFSVAETIFATYAGLRGALCIALALTAADNATHIGHDETGEELFFMITGLASLTLLFNGSTAGQVLLKLKLVDDPNAPVSRQLQQVLCRIRLFLRMYLHRELVELKDELGKYNEKELFRLCELMRPELDRKENETNHKASVLTDQSLHVPILQQMDISHLNLHNDGPNRQQIEEHFNKAMFSSLGAESDSDQRQISMRVSGSTVVDPDLLAYTRETFLNVVRARYQDSIESGKIGSSSASSKMLLHSLDVAMDYIHEKLADWEVIEQKLHPNQVLVQIASRMDSFFYCFGLYSGLVSRLDAYYERIAMYVLMNFIDAHEYAQSRVHFFLGGMIDGPAEDIAAPEERQVLLESYGLIERAKSLLSGIEEKDLLLMYTHRAAKVIIHKQGEMLQHMVDEGIISEKNARSLFDTYENERNQLDMERAREDKNMLRGNITKKIEEEKEFRESFRGSTSSLSPIHNMMVPRESLSALTAGNLQISQHQQSVDIITTIRGSPVPDSIVSSIEGQGKSSPIPIPPFSPGIGGGADAERGSELSIRGSLATSLSPKRGGGIFNQLANNSSNIASSPIVEL